MGETGIALIDGTAAAIVLGGTLLASVLGQGWPAVRSAAGLARSPFDTSANRAALARVLHGIKRDGYYAVDAALPPDPALAAQVAAYLRLGDIAHLRAVRSTERRVRGAQCKAAVMVWRHAAETAPVAGLAGTLYAIAGLVPTVGAGLAEITAAALATAVISSLYGLVLAHLVCLPLAGAIARRAAAEDAARTQLMQWFESHLPLTRRPGGPAQPGPQFAEAA